MLGFIERLMKTHTEEAMCHQYIDIIQKYSQITPVPAMTPEELNVEMYLVLLTGILGTSVVFGTSYILKSVYVNYKMRRTTDDKATECEEESDGYESEDVCKCEAKTESTECQDPSFLEAVVKEEKTAKNILESIYNDIDAQNEKPYTRARLFSR